MKFNSKTAKEIGTTGGSAIVGTKISKAVNELIPANWKNPGVHGAVMLVSIAAAAMIPGNGLGAQIGRGLALGVAVNQGSEAADQIVAPMLPVADTKAKQLLASAFSANAATGVQGYRALRSSYSPQVLEAVNMQPSQGGFAAI
jgi:hypothetical protein